MGLGVVELGLGEAAGVEAVVNVAIEGQHGRAGVGGAEGLRPLGVAGHVEGRQGVGEVHQLGHLGVGQLTQGGDQLGGIVEVFGLGEAWGGEGRLVVEGLGGDSTKIMVTGSKATGPILANGAAPHQAMGSRWVVTSTPGSFGHQRGLDLVEQGVAVAHRPVARHPHHHLHEGGGPGAPGAQPLEGHAAGLEARQHARPGDGVAVEAAVHQAIHRFAHQMPGFAGDVEADRDGDQGSRRSQPSTPPAQRRR